MSAHECITRVHLLGECHDHCYHNQLFYALKVVHVLHVAHRAPGFPFQNISFSVYGFGRFRFKVKFLSIFRFEGSIYISKVLYKLTSVLKHENIYTVLANLTKQHTLAIAHSSARSTSFASLASLACVIVRIT